MDFVRHNNYATSFIGRMTRYPNEIEAFLDWLSERAEERNLDFNSYVDSSTQIGRYWRKPEVAARVRATKKPDTLL